MTPEMAKDYGLIDAIIEPSVKSLGVGHSPNGQSVLKAPGVTPSS
jgi:hypothetical protein